MNDFKAEQAADLQRVYRASLSLLYKLLFLLYGEARNLLPMQNAGYAYESLTRMAERFATWRDGGRPISRATHATREYDHLLALFHRIDRGDPDLGIPRYNGGLFNPTTADNEFLETHKLSDGQAIVTVVLGWLVVFLITMAVGLVFGIGSLGVGALTGF